MHNFPKRIDAKGGVINYVQDLNSSPRFHLVKKDTAICKIKEIFMNYKHNIHVTCYIKFNLYSCLYFVYIFTKTFCHRQDVTHGQFLSRLIVMVKGVGDQMITQLRN